MNILYLSFYFPPDLCAGSFRTKSIVNALEKEMSSHDKLTIFTTRPNRYKSYNVDSLYYETYSNIEIYRFSVPKHSSGFVDQSISFLFYAFKALWYSRKIRPDIVVSTTSRLMTGVLGAVLSDIKKSKYFLDIRDIFTDTITEIFSKKNKILSSTINILFSPLEKYAISKAGIVSIVSEGFNDYFLEKNITIKKLLFFPNGIDGEFLNNEGQIQYVMNKKIKVVYAGNIGDGQGMDKILPEVSIKLAATHEIYLYGDGSAKKKLENIIDKKNISNLFINDPVEREELIKIYQESDVLFLHLNDFESFKRVLPSKIFEYVALKKPIVAGVSGYAKKFLENHVPHAFIFSPCDVKQAVIALRDAKNIEVKEKDVSEFIEKFNRSEISVKMANEIKNLYI